MRPSFSMPAASPRRTSRIGDQGMPRREAALSEDAPQAEKRENGRNQIVPLVIDSDIQKDVGQDIEQNHDYGHPGISSQQMYQHAADSIHDITETAADNPQTDIFYRFHRQTGES